MANIYQIGRQYRARLIAGNAEAAAGLIDAFEGALGLIQAEQAALVEELAQTPNLTRSDIRSIAMAQSGLQRFEDSAREELERYNLLAAGVTEQQQRAASRLAAEALQASLTSGQAVAAGVGGSFNLVASEATETLVGFLSDGSPLGPVLTRAAGDAASEAARQLASGLAAGLPTDTIAGNVAAATGADLDTVLRIVRTETLRAYRTSGFDLYDSNADIIGRWMWVCGLQPNSCAACVAMHGTIHPLRDRINGHPNCGCAMVPIVDALPLEEQQPPQTGEEWLRDQDHDVQAAVFGSERAARRWRDGQFQLSDVVEVRQSEDWGPTVTRVTPQSR